MSNKAPAQLTTKNKIPKSLIILDDSPNSPPPMSQDTKDTIKYLSKCARDKAKTGWLKYAHVSNKDYLKWLCTDSSTVPAPIPKTHIRSFDVCSEPTSRVHTSLSRGCRSFSKDFIDIFSKQLNRSIAKIPKNPSVNVYTWTNNNCWIDSVLMIILMGKSSHIRDVIFQSDPRRTAYERLEQLGIISFRCSRTNYQAKPDEHRKWAIAFQKSLRDDYEALLSNPINKVFCTNTKHIIWKCITESKDSYGESVEFYNLITYMFPRLLLPIIDTIGRLDATNHVYRIEKIKKYAPVLDGHKYFGVSDKIGNVKFGNETRKVAIKKSTSNIIGNPPVIVIRLDNWPKYINELKTNDIKLDDSKLFRGAIIKSMFEASHDTFQELDIHIPETQNKMEIQGYELYATVVFKENPRHWISYFKPFDKPDTWMLYDDFENTYTEVDRKTVLTSQRNHNISIVFFMKTT